MTYGICWSCKGTGRFVRPSESKFPPSCGHCRGYGLLFGAWIPVEDAGRCEVCGLLSNAGVCESPQGFLHRQIEEATEKIRAGAVLVAQPSAQGAYFAEWLSSDEAEDRLEFASNQLTPEQWRRLDKSIRIAKLVRGGNPWWLAQAFVLAHNAEQIEFVTVNGYGTIGTSGFPSPLVFGPVVTPRPHQWLMTAWKFGIPTRYDPKNFVKLRQASRAVWGQYSEISYYEWLLRSTPYSPAFLSRLLDSVGATERSDFLDHAERCARGEWQALDPSEIPDEFRIDEEDMARCRKLIEQQERVFTSWAGTGVQVKRVSSEDSG